MKTSAQALSDLMKLVIQMRGFQRAFFAERGNQFLKNQHLKNSREAEKITDGYMKLLNFNFKDGHPSSPTAVTHCAKAFDWMISQMDGDQGMKIENVLQLTALQIIELYEQHIKATTEQNG